MQKVGLGWCSADDTAAALAWQRYYCCCHAENGLPAGC